MILSLMPPFKQNDIERFKGFDSVTCLWNTPELAEAVFGNIKPEQIAALPMLRWVQSTNAGVDNYIKARDVIGSNVVITTASGAFGQSISECVLAMVLSLYKHLNLFRDNQNRAVWQDEGRQYSPCGKRVLLVGTGNIGSSAAKLFKAFGCETIGIRKNAEAPKPEYIDTCFGMDRLDSVLPIADIIVCSLPDTVYTRKLFDKQRFALMNPGAVFVNVGRGSAVDTDALYEILSQNRIYGAALDVTDPEPLPKEHPLWQCANCIITPHATGGSFGHLSQTEDKIIEICGENLRRYLSGAELLNKVDFESGYRSKDNRY